MRLIDADNALELFRAEYQKTENLIKQGEKQLDSLAEGYTEAAHIIKYISLTVDAVPVVRCRECRYYAASGATTSFCIHPGGMKFTSDSDYCSRGQRRDQSADVRNMGQFASPGKTGGQNDADQL